MIIFGWGPRQSSYFAWATTPCTVCSCRAMTILQIRFWFRLFFIPLIPYRTERYAECPACGAARSPSQEHARIAHSDSGVVTEELNRVLSDPQTAASAYRLMDELAVRADMIRASEAALAPVQHQQHAVPAGWYPDPYGRHQYRYWNAVQWTASVSNHGVAMTETAH